MTNPVIREWCFNLGPMLEHIVVIEARNCSFMKWIPSHTELHNNGIPMVCHAEVTFPTFN